ncbi:MAG: TerC family protein, partial [Blastococcus sp.]
MTVSVAAQASAELPVWFEVATFVGLVALLLADLALVARRKHEPSIREASLWVSFYVGLALAFGVVFLMVTDGRLAGEFYAGWLTEYSLSLDNLFVFVLLIGGSGVAARLRSRVLLAGIGLALL